MSIENIIQSLLSPDNALRKQAEEHYNNYLLTQPEAFATSHFELMKSTNEETRHTALTFLHSALNKKIEPQLFLRFSLQLQQNFVNQLLQIFANETSIRCVRMLSEVLLIGCFHLQKAKQNLGPYYTAIVRLTQSQIEAQRLLSYLILPSLVILLPDQDTISINQEVITLINNGFNDQSYEVSLASLDCFVTSVLMYDGDYQNKFVALMPPAIQLFGKYLSSGNATVINKSLEIVSNFSFFPKPILQPYVLVFVNGLLTLSSTESVDIDIRILGMNTLLELVTPFKFLFKRESGTLTKVLLVIYSWLTQASDDVQTWANGESPDEETFTSAKDVVTQASELFGGEALNNFVSTQNPTNWKEELAVLTWVTISLDGGKHYYKKRIPLIFEFIRKYINSSQPRVRYASYNLLNTTVTIFGKKVKQFATDILNVIKQALGDQFQPNVVCGCDILSSFIDVELVSADDLMPSSATLFEHLTNFISNPNSNIKLIIAAFASLNFLIHYMNGKLEPIFSFLLNFFKSKASALNQLIATATDSTQRKNMLKVKSRLIEGLSMLVYSCSNLINEQIATEIFQEVYGVFSFNEDDRDILMPYAEKAFTRLAGVMKNVIAPYLDTIVPVILERANRKPQVLIGETNEDMDDEDWAQTKNSGLNFGIKTSQIEEKSDAIATLDLFVDDLQELMLPYIDKLVDVVDCIKFYLDETVRMKATTLMSTIYRIRFEVLKQQQPNQAVNIMKSSDFYKKIFKAFVEHIPKEAESSVAIQQIDRFGEMIQMLGMNGLSGEELTYIFQMISKVFESYEESEKQKKAETGNIEGMTDEELEMMNHMNSSETESIMTCQHLFQTILKYNEGYYQIYQTVLHPFVTKFYLSNDPDLVSCAMVYIQDLVVVGKRSELLGDVLTQFTNYIRSDHADCQFNALLSLAEIIRSTPSQVIQQIFQTLAQNLKWCEMLRGSQKNDIFEASIICNGSLLIHHGELCQSYGLNVTTLVDEWFGYVMNLKTVKDVCISFVVDAVEKNILKISSVERLLHFVMFVGTVLAEEVIDKDVIGPRLKAVFISLQAQFSKEIFNDVWGRLPIEVREEIFELLKN
ncbi:Importin beta family protein 3 [Entamoeba marina]